MWNNFYQVNICISKIERKDLKMFKVVLLGLWVFSFFIFVSSKCLYWGCISSLTLEKFKLDPDKGFCVNSLFYNGFFQSVNLVLRALVNFTNCSTATLPSLIKTVLLRHPQICQPTCPRPLWLSQAPSAAPPKTTSNCTGWKDPFRHIFFPKLHLGNLVLSKKEGRKKEKKKGERRGEDRQERRERKRKRETKWGREEEREAGTVWHLMILRLSRRVNS